MASAWLKHSCVLHSQCSEYKMVASAFQNYVISRLPVSSHKGITLKGKHRIVGLNLYHSMRPYVGL